MTFEKSVLGIVPGLQATALLGPNIKLATDSFKMKKGKMNYMKQSKQFVRTGVGTIVGVGILGATSEMINKI